MLAPRQLGDFLPWEGMIGDRNSQGLPMRKTVGLGGGYDNRRETKAHGMPDEGFSLCQRRLRRPEHQRAFCPRRKEAKQNLTADLRKASVVSTRAPSLSLWEQGAPPFLLHSSGVAASEHAGIRVPTSRSPQPLHPV